MDIFSSYLSLAGLLMIIYIFSKEKVDYVFYALLISISLCVYYSITLDLTLLQIRSMILVEPLIYLICMQMILEIAKEHRIFDYVALKLIHLTNGKIKNLYYTLCFISSILTGFLPTTMVVLIFGSFIIKACKIMGLKAHPFLFGIYICAILGCLLTPFSSAIVLIISNEYNLNFNWFLQYTFPFVIPLIIITLIIIERKYLEPIIKNKEIDERRINLLIELLRPESVIEDEKAFKKNGIMIGIIFISLLLFQKPYLVAIFSCLFILKLNNKNVPQFVKKVDWKFILYLASLYLTIGCMRISGAFEIISIGITFMADNLAQGSIILIFIFIIFITGIISGFLSASMITLIMLAIFDFWFGIHPEFPSFTSLFAFALMTSALLGTNLTPHGGTATILMMDLAEQNHILELNYKGVFSIGFKITLLHLFLSAIYLIIIYLFYG
mgnify:CR=1 FL=1